jgi:hypothetical protein
MHFQKVISKKNLKKENIVFCWRLEVHCRKLQDPDHWDPRTLTSTKMSRIRNTEIWNDLS